VHQNRPRAFRLATPSRPTTRWSCTVDPQRAARFHHLLGHLHISAGGEGRPRWLCTRIKDEADSSSARRITSRG